MVSIGIITAIMVSVLIENTCVPEWMIWENNGRAPQDETAKP